MASFATSSNAPLSRLPAFPWDLIASHAQRAAEHPDGLVDLSVGTPVDPTPDVIQAALVESANSPGYPTTHGTVEFRQAAVKWMARSAGAIDVDPAAVLPVIGTKEIVAWLPTMLGVGAGQRIVIPELAYPTYDVGARLSQAEPVVAADPTLVEGDVSMVWINSPSNPTGEVLSAERMRAIVDWARDRGALVVSDECYLELGWTAQPVSVLDPDVCGGSSEGVLAVHSLSKRSNLAGYRCGFVAGDERVIAELVELRKHAGMMVSGPVQAAATAALNDDAHVAVQRERYAARRELLAQALISAGFSISHSNAGLYLWASRGEPALASVAWLAERGILVAPGTFYGSAGAEHVRVALTATDERVRAAVSRL